MLNRKHNNPRNGYGNGGKCMCTNCGTVVKHGQGTPCTEITCPECGSKMIREELVKSNDSVGSNKRVAVITAEECIGCGKCIRYCPFAAIEMQNNIAVVDFDACRGCMKCMSACPTGAIKRA